MIDKRIEHYQKENARLFELIISTQTKSNKDSIIETIHEHEAVIRELKQIKKLSLGGVGNWMAFDEAKPKKHRLFLITNGSFVELAYYEDGIFEKPWKYDKYDNATLNAQQNGLKWQYIDLPTCC